MGMRNEEEGRRKKTGGKKERKRERERNDETTESGLDSQGKLGSRGQYGVFSRMVIYHRSSAVLFSLLLSVLLVSSFFSREDV